MSGGGLMQLVAYGSQDVYLTGNPQVTFFKQLYRRHTNFAMQSVEAQFNGNPGFGRRVSLVVPRVGDLMGKTYLQATLPSLELVAPNVPTWITEVGHFLIKEIELQIGGQVIDKHYGVWLSIWIQLTLESGKSSGYTQMTGYSSSTNGAQEIKKIPLWIPLQFWFCKNDGLALPLIALQYHEVRFVVQFASLSELTESSTSSQYAVGSLPELEDAKLFIDYIFLDSDERRKFATVSHEYLIGQLQFTGDEVLNTTGDTKIRLNFNHPVKELIWVCNSNASLIRQTSKYGIEDPSFTSDVVDSNNPILKAKLQFNGHDRFSERDGRYFSIVQQYQHHTNIAVTPGINVYSFALHPELEQPSGTANFSRIDNATLILSLTDSAQAEVNEETGEAVTHTAKIFAVGFNVLRIMSGMGGLAYSN